MRYNKKIVKIGDGAGIIIDKVLRAPSNVKVGDRVMFDFEKINTKVKK